MKSRFLTFLILAIMFTFIIPAANTFALEPEDVSAEGQSATKTQNILDAPSIYYRFDLGCQCNGWGYCGKSS